MIEIRIIDENNKEDINLANEAFNLYGKIIPNYVDEKWSYSVEKWSQEKVTQMKFPDENYDYNLMAENSVFIGAYDEGNCVGLAIMQDYYFSYMYLYDFKVNSHYRGQGIGKKLITKAKEVAATRGYKGIYTQGQDNNVDACLFYLNTGFEIGGMDTKVYQGTKQEGKSDIIFYLDI